MSQQFSPFSVFSPDGENPSQSIGGKKGHVWLVRLASGEIYRAQDSMVVARWLAEGRLLSSDEVSADGNSWLSLSQHPSFGSNYVQITRGIFGDDKTKTAAKPFVAALEPDWHTIRMEQNPTASLPRSQLPLPQLVYQESKPPKHETESVSTRLNQPKRSFGRGLGLLVLLIGSVALARVVFWSPFTADVPLATEAAEQEKEGLQGAHLISQAFNARRTGQLEASLEALGALHAATGQWPKQPALWASSLRLSLLLQEDYHLNAIWWHQYGKHVGSKADKASAQQKAQAHDLMAKQFGSMAHIAANEIRQLSGANKDMVPLLAYHAMLSGNLEQANQMLQQAQASSAPDSFSWLLGVRLAAAMPARKGKVIASDKERVWLAATQLPAQGLQQLDGIAVLAGQDTEILWQVAFLAAQRGDVRRAKHFLKELFAIAPKHHVALFLQQTLEHPSSHVAPPEFPMEIPTGEQKSTTLLQPLSSIQQMQASWQQLAGRIGNAWQVGLGVAQDARQSLVATAQLWMKQAEQIVQHDDGTDPSVSSSEQVPMLVSEHGPSPKGSVVAQPRGSASLTSPSKEGLADAALPAPSPESQEATANSQSSTTLRSGIKLPSTSPIHVANPSVLQLPLSPTGSGQLMVQAQVARSGGSLPHAEELYRQVLQQEPSNVPAMIGLGWTMLHGGNPESAISWFQKALQLASRSTEANLGMAEAYAARGLSRDAIRYYRRVMAIDPGGTTARVARFALEKLAKE